MFVPFVDNSKDVFAYLLFATIWVDFDWLLNMAWTIS